MGDSDYQRRNNSSWADFYIICFPLKRGTPKSIDKQ